MTRGGEGGGDDRARARDDLPARSVGPLETTTGAPLDARQYWQMSDAELGGPRIRAHAPYVGGDWMRVGPDGIGRPDIRAQFVTNDGAVVLLHYTGLVRATDAIDKAAETGGTTGFDEQTMRMSLSFVTGAEYYAWLNQSLFIAEGRLHDGWVEYQGYRATWSREPPLSPIKWLPGDVSDKPREHAVPSSTDQRYFCSAGALPCALSFAPARPNNSRAMAASIAAISHPRIRARAVSCSSDRPRWRASRRSLPDVEFVFLRSMARSSLAKDFRRLNGYSSARFRHHQPSPSPMPILFARSPQCPDSPRLAPMRAERAEPCGGRPLLQSKETPDAWKTDRSYRR